MAPIDLLFDRADNVISISEIKYLSKPVPAKIIHDFESKIDIFPNPKNKTIHKVLICAPAPDQSLVDACYFDAIITIDDIFSYEKFISF